MTNCLVTGGAGFIGSHLVHSLVARGDQVRVLDNLSTGHLRNLEEVSNQIDFIEGDLRDEKVVVQAVQRVEVIFHDAALASVPRSVAFPLESHAHCVTGTLTLLNAARQAGVRRVIYAGSSSAYGNLPYEFEEGRGFSDPVVPLCSCKACR